MTVAPRREPLAFESLEDVAVALREAGSRLTTPRRLVLEALFSARGLVSAEQLAAAATVPLDLTSVYRNLEKLEELGVVRHVHVGHGPHEFLVCEACGRVEAVEPERLDRVRAVIREEFALEARFTHFPIHGTCADCR